MNSENETSSAEVPKNLEMGTVVDNEQNLGKSTAAKNERMYFNYGNEKTAPYTILVNGARINAEPLVLPTWIDSRSSEMKRAENKVAEGANLENEEDLKNIHNQLEESDLEGRAVSSMAAIFREYGDQVAIANREVEDGSGSQKSGMDSWKLGHQVDFTDKNNLVFVIGHNGKEKMLSLLGNVPNQSIVGVKMNFRMGPPLFEQNYLSKGSNGNEKEVGFTVRLTCSNDKGEEKVAKKLFFLFAKTEDEVENGEKTNNSDNTEDEELPMAA